MCVVLCYWLTFLWNNTQRLFSLKNQIRQQRVNIAGLNWFTENQWNISVKFLSQALIHIYFILDTPPLIWYTSQRKLIHNFTYFHMSINNKIRTHVPISSSVSYTHTIKTITPIIQLFNCSSYHFFVLDLIFSSFFVLLFK